MYTAAVTILYPELQDSRMLLHLQKFLSGLQVMSVHIQAYSQEEKEFRCHNGTPPLCVLLASNPTTKHELTRLSQSRNMSRLSWLLFLDDTTSLEHFFYGINIPFDCNFLVAQPRENRIHLTEVYRVAEGMSLLKYSYAVWNPDRGARRTTTKLYERRNNLHGVHMKGAAIEDPPITILKETDEIVTVDGFFGQVWALLERRLNFTTSFKRAAAYGKLVNGSWNGLVKMLRTHEVDVGLSEFTMTQERLGAVDFTFPLIITRYNVLIQQLLHEVLSWDDFLKPFSTGLWLMVGISVLVLSFMLSAFHNLGRHYGNAEADDPSRYGLYDSLCCVFSIFCQQGQDFTPKSISCRLVFLTAYLTAVILLSAYSAALISFLTKQSVVMPFRDLQGLLKDGTYRLGIMPDSAEYEMFENSASGYMHELFTKLIQHESSLLNTAEEGIKQVCLDKYAFVTTLHLITWHPVPCDVMALPDESFPVSMAIALSKNNPYKRIIDYNLHNLRDNGILKRLRLQWWKPQLPQLKSPWFTVDFYSVTPILVLMAAGVIIAGIFLVLERKWHQCQHKEPCEILHCNASSKINFSE
ncbi:glutamate receptor ionotropic, delta-2 isoform X2 [Cryptotermes secundus]|uniref:glutamate receptor ionotropic, delta-2 isoform X2 n=1 Tax=Cryptotermes secundus TaxID=105785 RepID=UPI000CD7DE91|nr:glutamate receptor ionotropic, delta-2 isoform X2 [Cryptotermes secundus]